MKICEKIINIIEKINETVGSIAKYLLLLMALALVFEVVARYVFNSPTIWVFDTCKHLLCYIGALAGGYALMYNAHVKVDIFYASLRLKGRAILDIITSALFFLFIIILFVESIRLASASWAIHERATSVLAPPLYYLKSAIVLGSALILLQGIAKLLRDIMTLVTGNDYSGKSMNYQ